MLRKFVCLYILFVAFTVQAQEYYWKLGLDYFFDNTEYGASSFVDSETMNGIWLNPLGGIGWDSRHAVFAGVNLLKIPGMHKAVDEVEVTAYYQYKAPKILFRAGAFPRKEVLANYGNFFFKDSVNHFIPLIQGFFFQVGDEDLFFNAWFDRTGYSTKDLREHFFVGLSGKATFDAFFADFQSYMYHYAGTRPATPGQGVSEHLQLQASVGMQYDNRQGFTGLISAGTLMGYERDRRDENSLYKPIGFTARADAEYHGIGIRNTLYAGDRRMRLTETVGRQLYWGTEFLGGDFYLENEWYIRLIESDRVKARFNCNLHFTEGNVLFQQMLTVSAFIDNFPRTERKKPTFPLAEIFK